jgi:autotransporter-associated beta strand protein
MITGTIGTNVTGVTQDSATSQLVLTASNSYSGPTTVNAGELVLASSTGEAAGATSAVNVAGGATLLLGQSDQVNDVATITLSGGTIRRDGSASEIFGNLNLTAASFLDYGAAQTAGLLRFGAYTPASLLTVLNFLPGNKLQFGNTLTQEQLDNGGLFAFSNAFASGIEGGVFTITAIPETSTWAAAAGLIALLLWPMRRRVSKEAELRRGLRAVEP